jgi:DNA-binding MarR family transcriptional regulator
MASSRSRLRGERPERNGAVTGLAAELNKRKPFDTPEQEAYLSLLRTLSILSAEVDRLFRRHGLSEATYNALRILRGAGAGGRPCTEIGRDMVARVPDVTRIVDRLEKAGLATRCRILEDRRVVQIRITQKGLDLLAKLDEPVMDIHKRQFQGLSQGEVLELTRLLERARRPEKATSSESA